MLGVIVWGSGLSTQDEGSRLNTFGAISLVVWGGLGSVAAAQELEDWVLALAS